MLMDAGAVLFCNGLMVLMMGVNWLIPLPKIYYTISSNGLCHFDIGGNLFPKSN